MDLKTLINSAIDALSIYGNITVAVDSKDNDEWKRRLVPWADVRSTEENGSEKRFVITGGRADCKSKSEEMD